ncbi:hypothetical protein KJ359_005789 [Pestalotiopsis sp. 9143b]|nr:hypothetical protein KJ359_005789 [Pestalotiopsis sp. 9143b]
MAYRILGGRPRSAAPSAPSDVVVHDATPTTSSEPGPTPLTLAERIKRRNQARKTEAHLDSEDEPDGETKAAEAARTPRRPGRDDPPAWWEKTQDGIGISSILWGRPGTWRRRLVDTLWSAGPACCWASLAAFVVLNLAVLVCEGPRYLYSSGLLFVAVAIPFPLLGIRWWRKSSWRT